MIVHGFVQAGGGSTRFGRDKALVELGGQSMLARTTELVAKTCDSVRIVAPSAKYSEASAPILEDRYPGEGPLGGILTAMSALATLSPTSEWALILGCDMPFLTPEFLTFLRSQTETSFAQVIVPRSESGLEPLCAVWHVSALAVVQAAFDSHVRKVAEAMKTLPMEVLDETVWKRFDTHNRLFWNMNTPQDYDEARRILEGQSTA
ncbi:MAG TPA: molybdenum cofactor guanylyltransferase [Dongiaceae bacterium]|nr:molybdenum cofactor guanylyltransferase [Dongiaceae bacterium]